MSGPTLLPRPDAGPRPNPGAARPYRSPAPSAPTDLWLAGNEGRPAAPVALRLAGDALRRYPSTADVAARAAARFGTRPERVLVTAGADDALLRLALAYLAPGRSAVLPVPTFEMIPRYAALAGGEVREVAWAPGTPYPLDAVLAAVDASTSLVYVVSPNNPTGAVATAADVARIAGAAPHALVVVDQAYGEFADEDLTAPALALPNAVVLRTLSKAYGAAGLRVGFALGEPAVLGALAAAGNPYPCASPALAAAAELLEADVTPSVRAVRDERARLRARLVELGLDAAPGQGNFVFVPTERADRVRALVAGAGVALRSFGDSLRITCPADEGAFARLDAALVAALRPDALLFDMDGVLVDVGRSYRAAILGTAASFGVALTDADVDAAKARGGANDDWRLTRELMAAAGVEVDLDAVTARFEELYQGSADHPGLREHETALVSRPRLEALAARFPLGIVTGRPRGDAERFLRDAGMRDLFEVVVTRDDAAALKPDPAPTALALERLGARAAWLLGDTPDDVRSARGAGVLPVGVVPPGLDGARAAAVARSLTEAGAGLVLATIDDLEEVLP